LKLHLDGARLFNAMTAKGYTARQIGAEVDSIAVCFSKGLGAPVGSILIGEREFIRKARRIRKVFGGGMRQGGFLAAAGLYALKNNIPRLSADHAHAKQIAAALSPLPWVKSILEPETNIVIFEIDDRVASVEKVLHYLEQNDVLATQFGKHQIRMVTHMDVTAEMIDKACEMLKRFS
jgi:threonine aldolase